MELDPDVVFAHLAVRTGAVDEPTVRRALEASRARAREGRPARLVEILLEDGTLPRERARDLLERQGTVMRKFREIVSGEAADPSDQALARAHARGRLRGVDLRRGLEIQASGDPRSLSDVLISRGVVRPADLAEPSRFGKFEILEELGRARFGTIHRAREDRTGRILALKRLSIDGAVSAEAIDRFETEARVLAGLSHRNLVEILEAGRIGGVPYYTMPIVEGRPLSEILSGSGARSAAEAVPLVLPVCEAVALLHEAGLVHGDLTPEAILVTPEGTPVLLDVGIARRLGESAEWTVSGRGLGATAYMSPERIRDDLAGGEGPPADVWSLGAVLYEAIEGRHPFAGGPLAERLARIAYGSSPDPLRSAGADRRLEAILACALTADPARRYPDARALAEDLKRWRAGQAPLAPPVGFRARLAVSLDARRWIPAAIVAGGILLSTLVVALSSPRDESAAEARSRLAAAWEDASASRDLARLGVLAEARAGLDPHAEPLAVPALDPDRADPALLARAVGSRAHAAAFERWRDGLARSPRLGLLPAVDAEGNVVAGPYRAFLEASGVPSIAAGPGESVGLVPGIEYVLRLSGPGLAPYEVALPALGSGSEVAIRPLAIPFDPVEPGRKIVAAVRPGNPLTVTADAVASVPPDPVDLLPRAVANVEAGRRLLAAYTPAAREWAAAVRSGDRGRLASAAAALRDAVAGLDLPDDLAIEREALARAVAEAEARAAGRGGDAAVLDRVRGEGEVPGGRLAHLGAPARPEVFVERSDTIDVCRQPVRNVAFEPGGERFYSFCNDGAIELWDLTSSPPRSIVRLAHRGGPQSRLAIHPGRGWIAATREAGGLSLWRAGLDGASEIHFAQRTVLGLAFAPEDPILVVSAPEAGIDLWDVEQDRELERLAFPRLPVAGLAVAPDGRRVVMAAVGRNRVNPIVVMGLEGRAERVELGAYREELPGVAFDPTGRWIGIQSRDPRLRVFDATTGELAHVLEDVRPASEAFAFGPDGRSIVYQVLDGTLAVHDLDDGRRIGHLSRLPDPIGSIAVATSGRLVVAGDRAGRVQVLRVRSGAFDRFGKGR